MFTGLSQCDHISLKQIKSNRHSNKYLLLGKIKVSLSCVCFVSVRAAKGRCVLASRRAKHPTCLVLLHNLVGFHFRGENSLRRREKLWSQRGCKPYFTSRCFRCIRPRKHVTQIAFQANGKTNGPRRPSGNNKPAKRPAAHYFPFDRRNNKCKSSSLPLFFCLVHRHGRIS